MVRTVERLLRLWGAVLIAVMPLGGCATSPRASSPAGPPWYGDLQALAVEAARCRGLTLTQKFTVAAVDDGTFFAQLRRFEQPQNAAVESEIGRLFRALTGRRLQSASANAIEEWRGVEEEQLVAFYDSARKELVVRRDPPRAHTNSFELLAHEVGHVLQDQLGLHIDTGGGFDTYLARRAVIEGDASLTALLVLAARQGVSPNRIIERRRIGLHSMTMTQSLEYDIESPRLNAAHAGVRGYYEFLY
jgi:hypothetical protein